MGSIVKEISKLEIFSEVFLKEYFSSLMFDLDESFSSRTYSILSDGKRNRGHRNCSGT